MKKNKIMRLAAFLFVLTALTTCVLSGTYAKYVTSGAANDSARVAKWGVTIDAHGDQSVFKNSYAADGATQIENTVVATDKVVAPGTMGQMAAVTFTGTPEVAFNITYAAEVTLGDNWTAGGEYYCPLIVKVGDATLIGTSYKSAAEFEAAIEEKIASYSNDFPASGVVNSLGVISWEWPFETYVKEELADAQDTELGNAANAEISIKVTTTVTQLN